MAACAFAFLLLLFPACARIDRLVYGPDRQHFDDMPCRVPVYLFAEADVDGPEVISVPLQQFLAPDEAVVSTRAYDPDEEKEVAVQLEDCDADGKITQADAIAALVKLEGRRWKRIWLYCSPAPTGQHAPGEEVWTVTKQADGYLLRGRGIRGRPLEVVLAGDTLLPASVALGDRRLELDCTWPCGSDTANGAVHFATGPIRACVFCSGRRLYADVLGNVTVQVPLDGASSDPARTWLTVSSAWGGDDMPVCAGRAGWQFFENPYRLQKLLLDIVPRAAAGKLPRAHKVICGERGMAGGCVRRGSGIGYCLTQRRPGGEAELAVGSGRVFQRTKLVATPHSPGMVEAVLSVLTASDAADGRRMLRTLKAQWHPARVLPEEKLLRELGEERLLLRRTGIEVADCKDALKQAHWNRRSAAQALEFNGARAARLQERCRQLALSGLARTAPAVRIKSAGVLLNAAALDAEGGRRLRSIERTARAARTLDEAAALIDSAQSKKIGRLVGSHVASPSAGRRVEFAAVLPPVHLGASVAPEETDGYYAPLRALGIDLAQLDACLDAEATSGRSELSQALLASLLAARRRQDVRTVCRVPGPCLQQDMFQHLVDRVGTAPDEVLAWLGPDVADDPARLSEGERQGRKADFRRWLARRYESLESLNAKWGTRFRNWDSVAPAAQLPARAGGSGWTPPERVDWAVVDTLTYALERQRQEAARLYAHFEKDHAGRLVLQPLEWAIPAGRESLVALCCEADGSDRSERRGAAVSVPTGRTPCRLTHAPHPGCVFDGRRQLWVTNVQPPAEGGPAGSAHLRRDVWTAIGFDARGFFCSDWAAGSWLDADGSASDSAVALGCVKAELDELTEAFKFRRDVVVGVYYSLACALRDPIDPSTRGVNEYLGLLLENDIPSAVVDAGAVMRGELESYEVLFIPYAPYIEPELKPWFERFLNQGGILVAEAATALYALDGSQEATIPGQGLHELFGAKAVGESPGLEAAPGRKGKLFDLKCDGAIPLALVAGDYSASLEGTTSATWVKRGEGAAVLLGEVAGERLPAILESLGWKRPLRVVEAEERGVQAFLLGDEERGKYLLIVNHSDAHHADVHVDSDRISAAADRFYDVLSLKSFRADALRGGWLKVGLDLTAGEVLLIALR